MTARHPGLAEHEEARRVAAGLSFADALRFEDEGWPHWRVRHLFWRRKDVPAEFRVEPDPRAILGMNETERAAWTERKARWISERRAWLEGRAGAEGD